MAEEIFNKIKESVDDLSPAVRDKIKSMLTKYRELDEDGKAEFMENAKEAFKNSVSKYTSGNWAFKFWMLIRSYATILAAIIFIATIFAFFGYKLYKSLTEREKKREEKRKLKQQKKRK
nr:uncharacterized protein LOC124214905 isoform X2 [Neodiprion pinetum]